MKNNFKKYMALLIISILLLAAAAPFTAIAQGESSKSITPLMYKLTDDIKVDVKSILNERVSVGTRVGAVVRLYNYGSKVVRVPEYEVRVKTDNGVEYILRPSAANAVAIQPKEKVELSYMITVERSDVFSLSELSWVDLDEFEYPQIEKLMLSIPVSVNEWRGASSVFTDPEVIKKWEEPFTVDILSSSLVFTPVNLIKQNTTQGPVSLVVLLAENKGKMKETVPDFSLDGKTDSKVYKGKRIDVEPLALEPGEKKNIHFAIPTENKIDLKSLNVLTPEEFVGSNQTKINYTIGRLNIQLPNNGIALGWIDQLEAYDTNMPIRFDPLNSLIQPEVSVSLVELHMHQSEGDGYKTVIAKFKLNNSGESPLPVPNFQAELMSADGFSYVGSRQNAAAQTLIPNLSYIISYSFNVPNSEKGDRLGMRIMDGQKAAPFNIPIASFRTKIQNNDSDSKLVFYPFNVNLKDWTIGSQIIPGNLTYSYKLRLELEVERQDNIVVDQNFSKMKIELVDSLDRILSSESLPFTSTGRLVSGWQTVNFNSLRTEQFEFPLTARIYETIETPFGEAKRLVKTLKQ
ncbi:MULTISPECIES: hypothetical protein [unclassified Paenibacillus]|uniref:hypothetical protein n=1 Tax=unclassified Paenibacillus TaxID=185978 RepID=UPI0036392454